MAMTSENRGKSRSNILSPKQQLFLEYYFKPDSATYGNARGSALKAGFGEKYANTVIHRKDIKWIEEAKKAYAIETVSTQELVEKAVRNLNEAIEGRFDESGKNHYKYKATEFIASRAHKDFSDKQRIDITSAGLPLQDTVLTAMLKVYDETEP